MQVEGDRLRGLLLVACQSREPVGEGVGDTEVHFLLGECFSVARVPGLPSNHLGALSDQGRSLFLFGLSHLRIGL